MGRAVFHFDIVSIYAWLSASARPSSPAPPCAPASSRGATPATPAELRALADGAGLDGDALLEATGRQDVKDELRAVTEGAHAAGVVGVPAVVVDGRAFWGDDRLEEAAAAAQRM